MQKTKNKYQYNKDLETFLITLSDDQFCDWLEDNEIQYENPSLLDVIQKDLKLDESNKLL